MRDSTGKLVARSEERNRETIPMPRFARRPSTMNSFFPAEGSYPQNHVAGQSRLQISELQFYRVCGDSRVWYEYFPVVTRDVLSCALVSPESFPVESTRVRFWSAQYELCKFVSHSMELSSCCCSVQCEKCKNCSAHQVLVVVLFPCDSSSCTRDCVFLT